MARKGNRLSIERVKAKNYFLVAENFFNGADVAREYEYWNASGVLIVHAAIALTDAITIKLGGVKSRGENHYEAISLLEELVAPNEGSNQAFNNLHHLIEHKTLVSYSGEIYERKDIEKMWKWLVRFRTWALTILGF